MINCEIESTALKAQFDEDLRSNAENLRKTREEVFNLAKKMDALANPECPSIDHNHEAIWEHASTLNLITAISLPRLLHGTGVAHLTPLFVGAAVGSAISYTLAPSIETMATPWLIEFYKSNSDAIIGIGFPTAGIITAQLVKTYFQNVGGANPGAPENGNHIRMVIDNFDNNGVTAAVSTVLLGAGILSSAGGAEQAMACVSVDIALKTTVSGLGGVAASSLFSKVMLYVATSIGVLGGLIAAGANILCNEVMLPPLTLSDSIIGGLSGQVISSLSWYVHKDFAVYTAAIGYVAPLMAMGHKLYALDVDGSQKAKILSYNFLPAAIVGGPIMLYKYAFSSIPEKGFTGNEAPKVTEILNPIDQITLKDASAEPEIDIYSDTEYYEDQSSGQPSMDSSSEL